MDGIRRYRRYCEPEVLITLALFPTRGQPGVNGMKTAENECARPFPR